MKKHQPGCPCCIDCPQLVNCVDWMPGFPPVYNEFEVELSGVADQDCTDCDNLNGVYVATGFSVRVPTGYCRFGRTLSPTGVTVCSGTDTSLQCTVGFVGSDYVYPTDPSGGEMYISAGLSWNYPVPGGSDGNVIRGWKLLTPSVFATLCAGDPVELEDVESVRSFENPSNAYHCDVSAATMTLTNLV